NVFFASESVAPQPMNDEYVFPSVKPFNPHQLDDRQIEEQSENVGLVRVYEVIEREGRMALWRRRIHELCVHTDPQGREFFQCINCQRKSYHPKDIESLYCGHCHRFWGDVPIDGFMEKLISKM